MTTQQFPHRIRGPLASDARFILDSFARSLYSSRPWRDLEPAYHRVTASLLLPRLLAPPTRLLVACDPAVEKQIFGYLAHRARQLVWVYVKDDFRRLGVGAALMRAAFDSFDAPIDYALRSAAIRHHVRRWRLRYRPALIGGWC